MLRIIQNQFSKYNFAIEKKLFIYDNGYSNPNHNNSGIRATIFGASGFIGAKLAPTIGQIGSSLIMPLSLDYHYRHSQHLKQLKLASSTNKSWVQYNFNLKNHQMIEDMVKNSNVVINLLGPRQYVKRRQDMEFINIEAAQRIAKACTKHGVHRLIHFSAAGAEPNSPSLDFQTKYQAQQIVRKAFPNVTIFRPCSVYGPNDRFAHLIQRQALFFINKLCFVFDDCKTLKQPIRDIDIAECVMNALKMQQTKGKTYELGGPNVLSMLEVHEIIFNMLKTKHTRIAYINPKIPLKICDYLYNWEFFGKQAILKKSIEEVVKNQRYGTISDLQVEPVTFKNGVFEILRQYIINYYEKDQDFEN